MSEAGRAETSRQAWRQAADETYREQISSNTLSELEDIYAHLDRAEFPDRMEAVRGEIERRLAALDRASETDDADARRAGLLLRTWASFLDLFVMCLIAGAAALLVWGGSGIVASFGDQDVVRAAPPPRPGPSPFAQFATGLAKGDSAAWTNTSQWRRVAGWAAAFLVLRGLFLVPLWVRSGRTPGMRELGLRLRSQGGGRVSPGQAVLKFLIQYPLCLATLGVSALCALRNPGGLTWHDRISGTRVVRERLPWEKPEEQRLLE